MNRYHVLIVVLNLFALVGCISHPQTAEEFRKAVPGAFSAKVETFEVDRPFSQVASTFQKMGPNCLSKTIKTTSQTTTSYQVIVTTYKPTVMVTGKKAELHVQFHHDQGVRRGQQGTGGRLLSSGRGCATRYSNQDPHRSLSPFDGPRRSDRGGDELGDRRECRVS